MTDLSTTNLQRLLEQVQPGPWRAEVGAAGVPEGWDEHWRALHMGDDSVFEVGYEPPTEQEYANFKLAALAPELAKEVMRMRQEIGQMYNALARTATDCATIDAPEGMLAARVAQSAAEQLFRILLEGETFNA